MLENFDFKNFNICDSHFHLYDLQNFENSEKIFSSDFKFLNNFLGISSSCSKKEFILQEEFIKNLNNIENVKIFQSFGIHPQNPFNSEIEFLENLLKNKKIIAVGECGLDFFPNFIDNSEIQKQIFYSQLELAEFYKIPVIIHARKCLEEIYRIHKILKNLPVVIFHSFFWSDFEAFNLLRKIPNSIFSFGKQVLNQNKKTISCIKNLPLQNLILETDSPFQTLKGEDFTSEKDIYKIYKSAYFYKKETEINLTFEDFSEALFKNFQKIMTNF